jgi:hypothetical protein
MRGRGSTTARSKACPSPPAFTTNTRNRLSYVPCTFPPTLHHTRDSSPLASETAALHRCTISSPPGSSYCTRLPILSQGTYLPLCCSISGPRGQPQLQAAAAQHQQASQEGPRCHPCLGVEGMPPSLAHLRRRRRCCPPAARHAAAAAAVAPCQGWGEGASRHPPSHPRQNAHPPAQVTLQTGHPYHPQGVAAARHAASPAGGAAAAAAEGRGRSPAAARRHSAHSHWAAGSLGSPQHPPQVCRQTAWRHHLAWPWAALLLLLQGLLLLLLR